LLTSDSLSDTVIVIELVLTISANDEVELGDVEEDEVLDPPRLPAVVPPVPPVPPVEEVEDDPVLDVVDAEALEVDPADTESPGERDASDTIVPLMGA
jgi:hypothetical protein